MENENVKKNRKLDLFKLMTNISLYSMIAIVILIVLAMFDKIKMSVELFQFLAILAVLCVSTWLAMPWAKRLQQDKRLKIVSIVFLSFIGLCMLLWIIAVFAGRNLFELIKASVSDSNLTDAEMEKLTKNALNIARFYKWSAIISVQFLAGNTIASSIIKYGKEKIPYQCIIYFCTLYLDFFFIMLMFLLKIDGSEGIVLRNKGFFSNVWTYILLVMSILLVAITAVFNNRFEKRKRKEDMDKNIREERVGVSAEREPTVEEKLAELKRLLENGVITQEEYDQKRADLISKL